MNCKNDTCKTEYCIDCSVKNCVYHGANDICEAGKISVGGHDAATPKETSCNTFKAKM